MRIAVLGGGSWGSALASHLAGLDHDVSMLVREDSVAEDINSNRRNSLYLPHLSLNSGVKATTDAEQGLAGAEICLLAVPCQYMRQTLVALAPHIPENAVPVCASKGIEVSSLMRMSQVVEEVLPRMAGRYAVLSSPSFAKEVIEGQPVAIVLACWEAAMGALLRDVFAGTSCRVSSGTDVGGVATGGA